MAEAPRVNPAWRHLWVALCSKGPLGAAVPQVHWELLVASQAVVVLAGGLA